MRLATDLHVMSVADWLPSNMIHTAGANPLNRLCRLGVRAPAPQSYDNGSNEPRRKGLALYTLGLTYCQFCQTPALDNNYLRRRTADHPGIGPEPPGQTDSPPTSGHWPRRPWGLSLSDYPIFALSPRKPDEHPTEKSLISAISSMGCVGAPLLVF